MVEILEEGVKLAVCSNEELEARDGDPGGLAFGDIVKSLGDDEDGVRVPRESKAGRRDVDFMRGVALAGHVQLPELFAEDVPAY